MKPLSNRQKAVLCQVARRAYDYLTARGQVSGINPENWRREACERAVGKSGLRACDNSDYNRLLAHFESLAGDDGRAMNALVRDATEPRRQAEAALVLAMDRAGLSPAYVEKICRDKFKCSVADASVQQLHKLIMDAKARGRARARKAQTRNPEPETVSTGSDSNPF